MKIKYTSSGGIVFDFSTLKDAPSPQPVKIKAADFHKWEYIADGVSRQYGISVSQYNREPAEYDVQLYVYGTVEERALYLENFHNEAMRDLALNSPGTLMWGNWEIMCVIIASDTYPHDTIPGVTVNDIRIYCPNPRWMKPEAHNIRKGMAKVRDDPPWSADRKFPTEFPFDFAMPIKPIKYTLAVDNGIPSDFVLKIFGPVLRPVIQIGKNIYGINYNIPAQAFAVINSRKHTVVMSNGLNLFNYRNFENSIFEKIANGKNVIIRSDDFAAKLIIYKESDEPKWSSLLQM